MSNPTTFTRGDEAAPAGTQRRSGGRRWRRIALIVVAIAAVVGIVVSQLLPSAADGPAVTGVTSVDIRDNAFDPPVIEVEEGTTVTWSFDDGDKEHNVVGEGWGSQTPQATGAFTHTFTDAGSYFYECTLHSGMDGRVDVVEG